MNMREMSLTARPMTTSSLLSLCLHRAMYIDVFDIDIDKACRNPAEDSSVLAKKWNLVEQSRKTVHQNMNW